jgi:hypothetical protein
MRLFFITESLKRLVLMIDIPCTTEFEQESGQMLIRRSDPDIWRALNLAVYMQVTPVYEGLLSGDKDTFRMAWRALKAPYHMTRPYLGTAGPEDCHMVPPLFFISPNYEQAMVQYYPRWGFEVFGRPPNGLKRLQDVPMFLHANLVNDNKAENRDQLFKMYSHYPHQIQVLAWIA